ARSKINAAATPINGTLGRWCRIPSLSMTLSLVLRASAADRPDDRHLRVKRSMSAVRPQRGLSR
ncbi:hypothetical protein, partial [Sphingomonas sp. CCH9-E2]|uniref:hypothetical protein n=1 Tax=Sphingomonas sp. CCH9-E2 TaxID=1768776 RepID=UPI001E2F3557